MKCSICGQEVTFWLRREDSLYCMPCYKTALDNPRGLSTHDNEEVNVHRDLGELERRA